MTRFAVLLVPALFFAAPALAQQAGPGMGGAGMGPSPGSGGYSSALPRSSHNQDDDDSKAAPDDAKPVPPPPAIPGAQAGSDTPVIPSDKLAAEMSPNEALFDAIDRGDIAAAKDALNRGAQLDAKNVLGQTPTDAAIDLNRNDITFLLLSMRSAMATGHPSESVQAARPAPIQVKAMRPPPPGDRGTPNPAVGFTGF